MDRLERLAFNALPAALWPDVTANVYHHRSNQLNCGGQYGYNLFFCCSSNVHQGWPKFLLSAVQTLVDGRVVISGYSPSTTVVNGANVTVSGTYPFSDVATITVSKPTRLRLRIPCWANGAAVTMPGLGTPQQALPCGFFNVSATAAAPITITFNNSIWLYRWAANTTDGSYSGKGPGQGPAGPNGGSIELHRGPLVFALRPNSTVTETPIGCIGGQPSGRYGWNCSSTPGGVPQFPAIKQRDVQVATAPGSGGNWSFAILPATAKFVETGAPVPAVPFSATAVPPVMITVQARNLNAGSGGSKVWGDPSVPPHSPLASDAALETIELVPFGSTNIRISVFPELES